MVKPLFFLMYYSSSNTDVQCGHLVASIAISVLQNGHFFVVGAAGFSSFFGAILAAIVFISFTIEKITNAIIRKLITAVIKFP